MGGSGGGLRREETKKGRRGKVGKEEAQDGGNVGRFGKSNLLAFRRRTFRLWTFRPRKTLIIFSTSIDTPLHGGGRYSGALSPSRGRGVSSSAQCSPITRTSVKGTNSLNQHGIYYRKERRT